jgi:hypothetical protein
MPLSTVPSDEGFWKIFWSGVLAVYGTVTGHQYAKFKKIEERIEHVQERIEDNHISNSTFEAHMNSIQLSLTANTKFTDANTRSLELLNIELKNKQDIA